MDISPVGPIASPSIRFSITEHATELAKANHEARLERPVATNPEASTQAPNVTTSVTYSPAIHAQAAHFQLLAQASAFAALHNHHQTPAADVPSVPKVTGVEGASVDVVG